jgi:hypothetical protein
MPPGSGPRVATASAVAVTTSEAVVATVSGNWNNPNNLGNVVTAWVSATSTGAATLTLNIRQTSAVTGTSILVAAVTYTFAGAQSTPVAIPVKAVDTSAYGNLQQGGAYSLTALGSNTDITLSSAIIELETSAPV